MFDLGWPPLKCCPLSDDLLANHLQCFLKLPPITLHSWFSVIGTFHPRHPCLAMHCHRYCLHSLRRQSVRPSVPLVSFSLPACSSLPPWWELDSLAMAAPRLDPFSTLSPCEPPFNFSPFLFLEKRGKNSDFWKEINEKRNADFTFGMRMRRRRTMCGWVFSFQGWWDFCPTRFALLPFAFSPLCQAEKLGAATAEEILVQMI